VELDQSARDPAVHSALKWAGTCLFNSAECKADNRSMGSPTELTRAARRFRIVVVLGSLPCVSPYSFPGSRFTDLPTRSLVLTTGKYSPLPSWSSQLALSLPQQPARHISNALDSYLVVQDWPSTFSDRSPQLGSRTFTIQIRTSVSGPLSRLDRHGAGGSPCALPLLSLWALCLGGPLGSAFARRGHRTPTDRRRTMIRPRVKSRVF